MRELGITFDTTVILYGRDTEGARKREVARTSRRPDRGRARGVDPDVLRRRGRPSARRRLRPVGAGGSSARDHTAVARRGSGVRCSRSPRARRHRRHRRGQGDLERRGPRGAGERPHVAGAHRRGQWLQLHPARWANRRRRLGQLRVGRVPHAALPERRQHDARVSGDRPNWAEAGITPDKWVAFYCGTGWRASETWFDAHVMGWSRVAVYDGGWLEWSSDPENNPVRERSRDRRAAPRGTAPL